MSNLYELEVLAGMKRSELQKLAKQHGIKANMKTDGLIKALAAVVDSNLEASNKVSSEEDTTCKSSASSTEDQSEVEASEEKPKSGRGRGRKQRRGRKAIKESPEKDLKKDVIAGGDNDTLSSATESDNQASSVTEDEKASPVAKKSKAKSKGRGRGRRGKQTKEEVLEQKMDLVVAPSAAAVTSSPAVSGRRSRSLQRTPLVSEPTLPTPPNSGSSRKVKRAIRRTTHTPQPAVIPAQTTPSSCTPKPAPSSNKRSSRTTPLTATPKTTPATIKTPAEAKTRGSTGKRSASGSAGSKAKKVRRGTFDKSPAKVAVEAPKSNSSLKDEIMAEIDRKVQMHVAKSKSSIPTRVQATKKTPGKKNWSKTHHGALDKMESIDAYLERKQKRAEALSATKKHRIPAVAKPVLKPKGFDFASPKPGNKPKNFSFASPKPTKTSMPTNPKSAKTVSFKVSKLKTPKKVTLPSSVAAPAVEKRKATPGVRKSISALTPGSVSRRSVGGMTPGNERKSFGGTKTPSRKSVGGLNAGDSRKSLGATKTPSRKSVGGALTPFGKTAMATSATKPKNMFDLKASLSKPLSYKPHTGKLKPFAESKINSANVRAPPSNVATAKTMMKKPPLKGRDARRAGNIKHRTQKRNDSFMANRGITGC
ncbi:LOW QUALITY PROTEIN: nucleolar and spindle-associated protein 1-like [Lytechinus variegatus]|uniref:LOW QUALITY PROTEIN: nucleolar and spindle-associated protein 1-like n=1 Tax=Lytechinus variegatus TaxID=7654 RepID=UPI001BB2B31D|nr:LOW QUALITY PROTEIN: nucleolar and spindle-associated protein 1-like [Lytechinus variegatus]